MYADVIICLANMDLEDEYRFDVVDYRDKSDGFSEKVRKFMKVKM